MWPIVMLIAALGALPPPRGELGPAPAAPPPLTRVAAAARAQPAPEPAPEPLRPPGGEATPRGALPRDEVASLVIASVVGSVMLASLVVAVAGQTPKPCAASLGCLAAP